MPLALANPNFSFTQIEHATGSVDPMGRPDPRWHNGTCARFSTTLEVEFEESDLPALRALFLQFGVRLPE